MWKIANLQVEKGKKITGYLESEWLEEQLPAFLTNGNEEGPTVLILGGIHGCEYTSIDAALKLGQSLQPEDVCGKIIVLPIANPASFYKRSIYVHPEDGKNLNRMFPGKQDGTASEKLAFFLNESIIKNVDYVIDLHGGDMIEALVPFTIYQTTEDEDLTEESKDFASLFGIQYVVGSTGQVNGSTYSCAAFQGKVAIIAEAGQQGILNQEQSLLLQEGSRNALRSIGVLEGEVVKEPVKVLKTFDWAMAEQTGLWYPNVEIGQEIQEGEIIGIITDEFGAPLKEYVARVSGVVLFLVTSLAINQGDPLLAIGN